MAYLGHGIPAVDKIRYDIHTGTGISPGDLIRGYYSQNGTRSLNNRNTYGWAMDAHRRLISLDPTGEEHGTKKLMNPSDVPKAYWLGDLFGDMEMGKDGKTYFSSFTYQQAIDAIADLQKASHQVWKYRMNQREMDAKALEKALHYLQWSYGGTDHPDSKPPTYTNKYHPLNHSFGEEGIWFTPTSLLGWSWMLLIRDLQHQISYRECEAWDCSREVPTVGLATGFPRKGREVRYCGNRCRSAQRNARDRDKMQALKNRIWVLEGRLNAKDE